MRGRVLALGAAFGLFGCTAVLGLEERPLDPNGDDAQVTVDAAGDTFAPEDDATEEDALVEDSGDASIVADTARGPDTSTSDTSTPDTTVVDTGKPSKDSSPPPIDTFVPDTFVPDTAVTDTSPTGPVLTIAVESTSETDVNLTAEGTVDWAHWGNTAVTAFNHRALGGGLIKPGSATGSPGMTGLSKKTFVWSDGLPTPSASTDDGLVFGTAGEGYAFDVAASLTKTRTLRLYIGWYSRAAGTVTATLSDGSAPAVMASSSGSALGMDYDRFVITFRAASPTASVTIKATRTMGAFAGGSLDFFAATLQ
jgi:hypothetical protein